MTDAQETGTADEAVFEAASEAEQVSLAQALIQRIAATGWGYGERERLGAWELRAAAGFTSLGDPGKPLAAALDEVARWYTARGLTPRIQTLVGSVLDRQTADLGHPADSPALRQTADLEAALRTLAATADPDRTAELSTELPDDFFSVYRRGLGHADAPAVLTRGGARLHFAVVRDTDGTPLAVGRLALDPTRRWGGLSAIHTAERARRQGLSRVILRELLAVGAQHGAHSAYLEVEAGNAPARGLYESLGFATTHAYHCRVLI